MISERKSTSDSGFLNREPRLPSNVKERDGDTCVFHASVLKEVSRDCVQACHFVPHSKGNELRSFFPWPLLPCLLSMQYLECLERFHEVPQEDRMHSVDTPWNVICLKDSWHKYVTKARAAILLMRSLEQDWAYTHCTNRYQIDSSQKKTSISRPNLALKKMANHIRICYTEKKSHTTTANLSRLLPILVSAVTQNIRRPLHHLNRAPPSECLLRGSATL